MSQEKKIEDKPGDDPNFSFRAAEAGQDPSANDAGGQPATGGEANELQKAVEKGQADFKASKKPDDGGGRLPEVPRPDDQKIMLNDFQKNQKYYNDLELKMDDLDRIEERVQEMERYLGIEGVNDIQFFLKNDVEKLDQKCIRLDDFIKVIEDKNFMLNDLYQKFDQLENFLKKGNKFTGQCMDLQTRAKMVEESEPHIEGFVKSLGKVQQLENFLNFQPVIGK